MLEILVLRPGRGPSSLTNPFCPSSDCHALAASADFLTSCSRGGQASHSSMTEATAAAASNQLHILHGGCSLAGILQGAQTPAQFKLLQQHVVAG